MKIPWKVFDNFDIFKEKYFCSLEYRIGGDKNDSVKRYGNRFFDRLP